MKMTFAKSLIAAAALALSAGAAQAVTAGTTVTIDESSVAGAAPHIVHADQLSGQYDEVLTATSATTVGATTTGNFVTEAIFNAGGWFLSGVAQSSQVNSIAPFGYGIYVKFSSIGTYSTTGGVTTFTTNSGVLQVFSDANQDTVYNVKTNATGNVNNLNLTSGAASITDDKLLASTSSLSFGVGTANPGVANGNFELMFSTLNLASPDGTAYFTAPRPFNLAIDLNGNFQSFNPVSGSSIALLNNSANAFFINPVPEPSALALAGIALFGAAMVTRRKNRKS